MVDKTGLLVKQETYLEAGIHIGTKLRTDDMRNFVFKRRDDGLFILDLRKADERLLAAAKIITKYKPEEVLVVASRAYSGNPASKFSNLTGIPASLGRFIPGTMTNLAYKKFKEPKILFVCDPRGERVAIAEAAKNGVPVVALCDTDNETKFIDLVIPVNNKGKRSLALIFYILAREIMLAQGKIASYEEFPYDLAYFERPVEDDVPETAKQEPAAEPVPEPEQSESVSEEPRAEEGS